MIKLALSFLLLACGIYGWRQRGLSPLVGYTTPAVAAAGIALVLNPDWATLAARWLGVGRGADLVLYLWTVLSALLIANIHFRLRSQQATLTILTRELAILEAKNKH